MSKRFVKLTRNEAKTVANNTRKALLRNNIIIHSHNFEYAERNNSLAEIRRVLTNPTHVGAAYNDDNELAIYLMSGSSRVVLRRAREEGKLIVITTVPIDRQLWLDNATPVERADDAPLHKQATMDIANNRIQPVRNM